MPDAFIARPDDKMLLKLMKIFDERNGKLILFYQALHVSFGIFAIAALATVVGAMAEMQYVGSLPIYLAFFGVASFFGAIFVSFFSLFDQVLGFKVLGALTRYSKLENKKNLEKVKLDDYRKVKFQSTFYSSYEPGFDFACFVRERTRRIKPIHKNSLEAEIAHSVVYSAHIARFQIVYSCIVLVLMLLVVASFSVAYAVYAISFLF